MHDWHGLVSRFITNLNAPMSISVLIVEDEPVIATDIEMTLTGADYTVVGIAYSSTKALDLLHRFRPDIVLLDIAIKGDKDGIDIAAIINDKYKVPFIYITSFADRETLDVYKRQPLWVMPEGRHDLTQRCDVQRHDK